MHLIMLVGPPASGKSTYCDKYLKDYLRISQDEQGRARHFIMYGEGLKSGAKIVVDRMNFNKIQRAKYIDLAKGYKTTIIFFDIPYDICLKRGLLRLNHPTVKDEVTLRKALGHFYSNFEVIDPSEADDIKYIDWKEE